MTLIGKRQPGGAAGLTWDKPGQVVDVPGDIAWELLCIPDGDFYEPSPDDIDLAGGDPPRRRPGRPRKHSFPDDDRVEVTEPYDGGGNLEPGFQIAGEVLE